MRRIFANLAIWTALCAIPGATGQPLSGPTQGITFDAPSRSLRPVLGSFGGATLGPAILDNLEFASVPGPSALHRRGIACRAGECFDFAGEGPELHQIPDQRGVPEGASWSANGNTAILYSLTEEWIRVFNRGEWGAQLDIRSLGGELASAAVSPDGTHKVFAIRGQHSGVFELRDGDAFVPLLAAEQPQSLAYSSNGATLYVLERDQVVEINADGLAQRWPLLGVDEPVDLLPSRDAAGRAVVYVAGRADHALFAYDSASHDLLEKVALTFAPTQIDPYGAGSFLLTARVGEDDLLWSYTTGRGAFFVPVTPAIAETAQRKVRR